MSLSKIECISCLYYKKCSIQTRMYMNYCGPRKNILKSQISKATIECKNLRGVVFQFKVHMSLCKISEAKKIKAMS